MSAAPAPETRRDAILEAALASFLHYGYRRTSLEEIARGAGLSRTGLYHHFRSKQAIFRASVEALYARSLAEAERAARAGGPLEPRLRALLEAKLARFYELLHRSRHGDELTDEGGRLCGEQIAAATARYQRLVARVLREAGGAGEIALAGAGLTPDAAARLLTLSAQGLEGPRAAPPTPEEYRTRLHQLVRTAVAGWSAPATARAASRRRKRP